MLHQLKGVLVDHNMFNLRLCSVTFSLSIYSVWFPIVLVKPYAQAMYVNVSRLLTSYRALSIVDLVDDIGIHLVFSCFLNVNWYNALM